MFIAENRTYATVLISRVGVHWYFFKNQPSRKWMIHFYSLTKPNILRACILPFTRLVYTCDLFIDLSSYRLSADHVSWTIVKTISLYSPRFFSAIAWICVARCSARHCDFIAHKSPHISPSVYLSYFPRFPSSAFSLLFKRVTCCLAKMKTSQWVNRSKRIGNKW